MNDFSVTKAAFSGYGLYFRRPALSLVLAIFGALTSMAIALMAFKIAGPEMTEMQSLQAGPMAGETRDPQAMLGLLGPIFQFVFLAVIAALSAAAVNSGAVYRAVLRPKASRFPFIGFMGDELRLLVVMVTIGVIMAIPSIILAVIGQIVAVAVMIGTGGAGAMQKLSQGGRPPASMLYAVFAVYGVIGLLIFLGGARFALASAQTIAERGIRIFGSWGLTNGRYWKVVGALSLSLITLIPVLCVYIGAMAGLTLVTGGELKSLSQPDYSSLAALFGPVAIARYVFGGILGSLAVVVTGSATAHIYRALAEGTEAPATEDDDDEDWDDED